MPGGVWKIQPGAPGAVFLVIEKSSAPKISPYGELAMDADGGIFFDGGQITDCADLVQKCLTNGR